MCDKWKMLDVDKPMRRKRHPLEACWQDVSNMEDTAA
jgi:hypothetical protein